MTEHKELNILHNDLRSELDAVITAIRMANNEWEKRCVYEDIGESSEGNKEYVEHLIRIAYLTLLSFLDRYQFHHLSRYLVDKWKHLETSLLDSYLSKRIDEPFLKSTDLLWEVAKSVSNLLPSYALTKSQQKLINLGEILERIPFAAKCISMDLKDETTVNGLAEALLLPIYPDLNSNPSLTLAESYRQPDTALQSTNTLIEYKYIAKKDDVRDVIDEMQADIRNYAQPPWKHLIFVVAQVEPFTTKEKLKSAILKEPSSFQSIDLILVAIQYVQQKKTGKHRT